MREEMTYICPNCKSVTYRFESLSDRCPVCHNGLVRTQFTKAEWQGKSPEEQMKIINALSAARQQDVVEQQLTQQAPPAPEHKPAAVKDHKTFYVVMIVLTVISIILNIVGYFSSFNEYDEPTIRTLIDANFGNINSVLLIALLVSKWKTKRQNTLIEQNEEIIELLKKK
jgi:uncharacterized Zn finger protein (UPF0148 family)